MEEIYLVIALKVFKIARDMYKAAETYRLFLPLLLSLFICQPLTQPSTVNQDENCDQNLRRKQLFKKKKVTTKYHR